MLRLDQIKLNLDQNEDDLRAKAARLLRLQPSELKSLQVLRRAIDARDDLSLVYTVAVEVADQARVLRRCRDRRVTVWDGSMPCPNRSAHRSSAPWSWGPVPPASSPPWC